MLCQLFVHRVESHVGQEMSNHITSVDIELVPTLDLTLGVAELIWCAGRECGWVGLIVHMGHRDMGVGTHILPTRWVPCASPSDEYRRHIPPILRPLWHPSREDRMHRRGRRNLISHCDRRVHWEGLTRELQLRSPCAKLGREIHSTCQYNHQALVLVP